MAPVIFDPEAIRNHPLNYLAAFWSKNYHGSQDSEVVRIPVGGFSILFGLLQTNAKQEILLAYCFIACTVWAVAILATALLCLLLRYIDGDQNTDTGFAISNGRRKWRGKRRGYGSRDSGDSREDWRILGTQAHSLTWDWSQESN